MYIKNKQTYLEDKMAYLLHYMILTLTCDLRHPKDCLNILQKKICKFGDFCSFEHTVSKMPSDDSEVQIEKMKKLERLIEAKDKEIKKLESKVLELESKEVFERTDSELESDIEESVTGTENELIFSCESCDFRTLLKGQQT